MAFKRFKTEEEQKLIELKKRKAKLLTGFLRRRTGLKPATIFVPTPYAEPKFPGINIDHVGGVSLIWLRLKLVEAFGEDVVPNEDTFKEGAMENYFIQIDIMGSKGPVDITFRCDYDEDLGPIIASPYTIVKYIGVDYYNQQFNKGEDYLKLFNINDYEILTRFELNPGS